MPPNLLAYGDNLDVLRRHIASESVDLVYLDPPFNSKEDYNLLFHDKGTAAAAQVEVFKDTWTWDEAAAAAHQEVVEAGGNVALSMRAFRSMLGATDAGLSMLAYVSFMAPRLVELHRVLRSSGVLYLHCDPTAAAPIKLLLDSVFGPHNFINEIAWKRSTTKGDYRQGAINWPRVHDRLFYYAKDARRTKTFHQPFAPYSADYVASKYGKKDDAGRSYMLDNLTAPGAGTRGHPRYELMGVVRYWRYGEEKMRRLIDEGRIVQPSPGAVPRYKRYLDEMPGVAVGDVWDDISPINSQAKERLPYPTQKPLALLERIIKASSDPGDLVLDPFCGCGSAIEAAQRLGRRWVGIDITHHATGVIKSRLVDAYGPDITNSYSVIGEPTTAEDAAVLARTDPYQFQSWALGLVGARLAGPTKKGGDKGIDGRLFFHEVDGGPSREIVISVKGGHLTPGFVRDLVGVISREEADIGVLISLEEPTPGMRAEAASASTLDTPRGRYPRIQLRTIVDLLGGRGIVHPVAYVPPSTLWPPEEVGTERGPKRHLARAASRATRAASPDDRGAIVRAGYAERSSSAISPEAQRSPRKSTRDRTVQRP